MTKNDLQKKVDTLAVEADRLLKEAYSTGLYYKDSMRYFEDLVEKVKALAARRNDS